MKVTFYLTYSCPLHFGSETCVNSFETIQNEQMKRGTITIPKAHFHNNTLDIVKKKVKMKIKWAPFSLNML